MHSNEEVNMRYEKLWTKTKTTNVQRVINTVIVVIITEWNVTSLLRSLLFINQWQKLWLPCSPNCLHYRTVQNYWYEWGLNAQHQLLSCNSNKSQRVKETLRQFIAINKHRPSLTWCASKWGNIMQEAPQKSGVINAFTIPWTWCRGRTWRMTSALFHSHISIIPCIWLSRLPNVCTTPYGNTPSWNEHQYDIIFTLFN